MFYYCTGMISSYFVIFLYVSFSCDFVQSLSGGAIQRFLLRYISFLIAAFGLHDSFVSSYQDHPVYI